MEIASPSNLSAQFVLLKAKLKRFKEVLRLFEAAMFLKNSQK